MPLQATSGAASYDAFGGGVPVVPNYIEDVFSTYLVTGDGTAPAVNNGIDLSTKGGLVWTKKRSAAGSHSLFDTARGANLRLISNDTAAQDSVNLSFTTTGFSNYTFDSGVTYASWTFRKQPKFFDVVTFVKDSSTNQRISHSLDSVPGCIIVKRVTSADDWYVYHRSLGGLNKWISLNSTGAVSTTAGAWGSSAPTDTDFGVSTNLLYDGGGTPLTYVAYVFAHDAGGFGLTGTDNVISCGSYTGNGSANGPTVTLGYEPQWLLVKSASTGGAGYNWVMIDNMRGFPVGSNDALLRANLSDAEVTSVDIASPTATGFNITTSDGGVNGSGQTYIYIAIRRGPMKVPTSGTSVFSPYTATLSAGTTVNAGLTPDLLFAKYRAGTDNPRWVDRLRGFANATGGTNPELYSNETSAESTSTAWSYNWNNTGYVIGNALNGLNSVIYAIKRAPSFFDEVCYTGTGVNPTNFNHNLGAVPELMILKKRSNTDRWEVYSAALGNTKRIDLNTDGAATTVSIWGGTPTTTQFSLTDNANVNQSGQTYVAYLFATCAGVSKVGSYTGTGTTQQINCGFTGGARFVLIKKTSGTGSWYVWDSARGIVSGNDPYLLLNSTAAEVTSTDYIDTYSAGFEISSTAPSEINENGGSFIFLAIS